jgi:hypothetical protein
MVFTFFSVSSEPALSKDSQYLFLVSFTRRPFLWPCGRRQSFVTKLALGAKFAKYTKLTKIPLRNLRNQRQKICVNLCESVKSVVKNQSIKTTKLCETNPIYEKPKLL